MISELKTLKFFKEIAKIPRESGNEEKISKFLVEFAKERNLFYICDQYNNVLIKKKTCNKPPIILQAHMDMVCEKEKTKVFDFSKDSIEIIQKDGFIQAKGTTLGADNGIGVAQILSILDSDIPCNIEAVFTVEEETTMKGAINFDIENLIGKRLLSLDGFEENTIVIESACFNDIIVKLPYILKKSNYMHSYEITITGMQGGHSGFDINKNRGNSNIELAKILGIINDIEIANFNGGEKFNVIPSQAIAQFSSNFSINELEKVCYTEEKKLEQKYNGIQIQVKAIDTVAETLDNEQSKKILNTIIEFPHGVICLNDRNEVTTSINLGSVNLKNKEFKIGLRSSRKNEEQKSINMLKEFCIQNSLQFILIGRQPGFESSETSQFIQDLIKTCPSDMFGEKPIVKSSHVALETGFFQEKIPNLQIAIISPNLYDAHSVSERVEIESIKKTDIWLQNFIENC